MDNVLFQLVYRRYIYLSMWFLEELIIYKNYEHLFQFVVLLESFLIVLLNLNVMKLWLKLALIALFLNSLVFPVAKYVNLSFGVSSSISLFIYTTILSFCVWAYLWFKNENFKVNWKIILLILVTSFLMLILNLSLWRALIISPNVGYPVLIANGAMVILAFYSSFFEKTQLSWKKLLAILFIFVGIMMVII